MEQRDGVALHGELDCAGDGGFGDAVERGLGLVHVEDGLGLAVLDIPVDVHDAGGGAVDLADRGGELEPSLFGGAVDFGDDGLEDGRAGRDLGDGDGSAVFFGDGRHARADAFRDVVALGGALVLREEVDLDVGHSGAAAQEVVADEAVEIIRRSGAGVDLVVAHLGFGADGGGDFAGGAGVLLEGGALGEVQDDLELRLVVEGEHLDLHRVDPDQAHRADRGGGDNEEEGPAPGAVREERAHEALVETRERVLGNGFVGGFGFFGERGVDEGRGIGGVLLRVVPPQHPQGGPRRDREGDEQGEHHGGAGADGNRAHVGAHEAADEGHREDGGDDGPGGEDGGVADLVDGLDGDLEQALAAAARQAHVADNVFDDDDGVVDEDADGEDQREEGDAVERVTIKVEHEERESEGDGDREEHDNRLAPAEEEEDQHGDAEDGDAHVEEQLVGFFGGGGAVVARDGDGDVGGDEGALERVDFREDGGDDIDGVGAGPLGEAEGDGGFLAGGGGSAATEEHVVGGFGGRIPEGGDIPEIDGAALGDADDDGADLAGVAEKRAGLQERFAIGGGLGAGVRLGVGLLQHRHEIRSAEVVGGEAGGIERDADLAALAADEGGLGDGGQGFDDVVHLGGDPAERGVVVARAVEGDGENRDVVDRARFDEGGGDAERDAVEIGLEFLVEADERGLEVGADLEADDRQVAAG